MAFPNDACWLAPTRRRRLGIYAFKSSRRRSYASYSLAADMATLSVQHTTSGLVPAYAPASGGGDKWLAEAGTTLNIVNGGGGSITVTVVGQIACNLGTLHNKTLVVGAGQSGEISGFDYHFIDTLGYINVTYSGVTSVTVAVTAA